MYCVVARAASAPTFVGLLTASSSDRFARFIAARPWLAHVRTRYRSPQTNGVIERFYGSLKYECLYRREIASGIELHDCCEDYRQLYNELRPHDSLDLYPPLATYLAEPLSFADEAVFVETTRLSFEAIQREQAASSGGEPITPIPTESLQDS